MSTTTMPQSSEQQAPPAPRPELGHLDLSRIAQDLQIRKLQVEAVVQLLDDGNTIPFITRYRKERTGGLDEEVLRTIQERIGLLRALADRKQTILRTIDSQGKLTDELKAAILAADNPKRLEDLYLPYKPSAAWPGPPATRGSNGSPWPSGKPTPSPPTCPVCCRRSSTPSRA
ncbi:MAG: Tex-like N-terminal domain-containing protein [Gemmataceae bacterium]